MRISISTKIFLGFIVVLLVFGFSSLYSVLRTSEIRDRVVLIREGIVPIEKDIQRLSERLGQVRSSLLQRTPRKGVLLRLGNRLSPENFTPFSDLKRAQARVRRVAEQTAELRLSTKNLLVVERKIQSIFEPPDNPDDVGLAEAFAATRTRYLNAISQESMDDARSLYGELRRQINDLQRQLRDVEKATSLSISRVNEEAKENEISVVRDVIFTSTIALIVSILVMLLTHQGIRRIRTLIDGVRSVSEGKYAFPVSITGGDEIAELASEFSRMGKSLQERNSQLEEQSKALVRSERFATIGKISTLITHEIRNPLSSIGLNAEMLEDELASYDGDTTEGLALLRAIGSEVDRLRDVTEEYLQFARLPKPEQEAVDLHGLVETLTQFTEPEMTRRGIQIQMTHEEGPFTGWVDSNQIRQALLNLIRNASEAIGESGGTILIHLKQIEDQVVVRVEDSGPGVPFEIQPHIFEAFYSTKPSGTGLGLSLIQQIVAAHGGEIHCKRSAALGGANFVMHLPMGD